MHAEPAAGRLHLARLHRSLTCSLAAQSAASTHRLDVRYGGANLGQKTAAPIPPRVFFRG